MAGQKQKKDMILEERELESAEQQHLIKGIQDELARSRCELTQERDVVRRNDDALKKLNDDNVSLRKALSAVEVSLRVKDEENGVLTVEVERLKRFKKEFEVKQLECLELKDQLGDMEAKLELLNTQLAIRNKAMKEVEKQLKDEVEASEKKDSEAAS